MKMWSPINTKISKDTKHFITGQTYGYEYNNNNNNDPEPIGLGADLPFL